MKPHEQSPHAVFASNPPPWRDSCYPPTPGGQHFVGTALAELLAEPPERSPAWLSSVYARLVVASSGPVLVGGEGPPAERLDRAGWFRLAEDANFASARRHAWPALPAVQELGIGVGSLAPKLVVVAEQDPYERLPMFARSGVWLFRALRHLGWDELTVYVTNALDREGRGNGAALTKLHDAFAPYDPTWVALGAIAHETLNGVEIEHVAVDHPSAARRFRFKDGIEGYAQKMEEAGLPRGPCDSVHRVADDGQTLLAERLGIPSTTSVRSTDLDHTARRDVPAPVLDKARMAFVLGEVRTIKEAAALASDKKSERKLIVKLARQQAWEVERERFYAEKREKSKASATEAEAKRIGSARALAWEATELMLQRIVADLRKEDTKVYAKDAKAINEVAMSLSDKGDASFDDEKKRLASMSPEAFAEELKKTLSNFGIEQPPDAKPA